MEFYGFAVDGYACAARELHLKSRGGDDDVCVNRLAGFGLDACCGHGFDGVGYDVCVAFSESSEEISVGADAETLFPGVVGGIEIGINGDAFG